MAQWRRFERVDGRGGAVEFREIRLEGIRCLLRWSVSKDKAHGSTSVLDDEAHARRHEAKKAAEWIRKGFAEVAAGAPADASAADAAVAAQVDVRVLDVVMAEAKYVAHSGFDPVPGFAEVYRWEATPGRRWPISGTTCFETADAARSRSTCVPIRMTVTQWRRFWGSSQRIGSCRSTAPRTTR
jgi:hypothetical protein